MFQNYVITAWRQIIGNPLFSFINIFGLAIALASCLLIMLFVREELSHDKHLPNADRIVRLHSAYRPKDAPPLLTVRSAGRMMKALKSYAPDLVESGVRLLTLEPTVTVGDKVFSESVVFADPSFFDVFALPWVYGDPSTAFNSPSDLVITSTTAMKYFGRIDVIGEVMTLCCMNNEPIEVSITGVIEDLPRTSHLDINMLVQMEESMFDFAPNLLATWTSVNTYTYFKLQPQVEAHELKERIWRWLDLESPLRDYFEEGTSPTDVFQPNVMPISEIYLKAADDAGTMGDMRSLGNQRMIYAFIGITLLVLLLAAINFMNLSTARASQRAREVALRKVLGASRKQLGFQFLGEAVAVAFLAMLLAMVAVELCLPLYNSAIGRTLEFSLAGELPLMLVLLATTLALGLISGSYPAIYLSRYMPARILRANQSADQPGSRLVRSLLVVFQFSVSIGLGICTAVIFAQTQFAQNMDTGFSVSNKLVLHRIGTSGVSEQRKTLATQLERIPGVKSVVFSSEVPSQDNENNTVFQLIDGAATSSAGEELVLNYYSVGKDFFQAYDMTLLAGREFNRESLSDEVATANGEESDSIAVASAVINESALRRLGFSSPQEALGKVLRADLFGAGTHDISIIGVASDVYFRSLKFGIRSSIFINQPNRFAEATISYSDSANSHDLRQAVEKVWGEVAPMTPISYEFLEGMVKSQYDDEKRQASLLAAFAVLAGVVASLGLYGLASFTAERRTKEIGIRKVLGARVRDIVGLLVWQFSHPVLIANLIAWPIAWVVVAGWLEGFEYRLGNGYVFLACCAAALLSLMIAWLTVAGRAVRVARANPIDALRYE
ncbi:ABC transporter permease [Congregibacter variabilis]|uniref:ABC transporter permease n=1 Tax=Congregibacter variabilis TaxID=3081200 RepID=A0ABZ0I6J4_9GAMM|nr:ABC transporter permease [Congregibacter sp. IMCC43200]